MFPQRDILVKGEQRRDMLLEAEKERLISRASRKHHPKMRQPKQPVARHPVPQDGGGLLLVFRKLLSI